MVLDAPWSRSTTSATRVLRSRPVQLLLLYPCLRALELGVESHVSALSRTPVSHALAEILKAVYAFLTLKYRRPGTPYRRPHYGQEEEEYFIGAGEHAATRRFAPSSRSYWPLAVCAGLFWAVHVHLYTKALDLNASATTLQVAAAFATVLVLIGQYVLFSRPGFNASAQVVALQIAGVLIAGSSLNSTPSIALLAIPASTALTMLSYELTYQAHPDVLPNYINLVSFISATVMHIAISVYTRVVPSDIVGHIIGMSAWDILIIPLRTASGIWALSIIFEFGSLSEGIFRSLSFVFFAFGSHTLVVEAWVGLVFGTCLNMWAGFTYLVGEIGLRIDDTESPGLRRRPEPGAPGHRRRAFTVAIALAMAAICFLFPLSDLASKPLSAERCANGRRAASVPALPNRRYHHFDDILLVVFFSHARYDVNLDHYREVYAEYFPNIVFVGPKTREDAGFRHSYDVLVDSYQADEDLRDDKNFKMAGRMAHHMLYTAMQEYPCYDGYLWAPFDTFLNIPRLEQFDLNTFWYHSPFAKYVPNKALGNDEENQNPKRHPSPARISPDISLNLTDGWRGWGPDWWWGDPHVGVAECMPAFLRTPEEQRLRLSAYFEGDTRFVGGSVDTLYIPGRHRERLLHTLGLFLETNCFLEIALPTVLHLIVPLDEEILYVDHHWIWYPPFNGDFVRQQWREGFEVDTFHTFHWGDVQEDGVWRDDPNLIEDTRDLLRQSAVRQETILPRR